MILQIGIQSFAYILFPDAFLLLLANLLQDKDDRNTVCETENLASHSKLSSPLASHSKVTSFACTPRSRVSVTSNLALSASSWMGAMADWRYTEANMPKCGEIGPLLDEGRVPRHGVTYVGDDRARRQT